ncbi:MAG TPA: methionine--tRNA ligase [Anaerolineales bacterium]|nr:methionine--tRNA ligase [Anaerolineales bacterium]
MPEKILVAVAWPYANADIHVGNITGAYLPADIFARYHRLKGNDVLMVSGSDAHGTPITVRADTEGLPAGVVYERFHARFLDLFQKAGLAYDLYTSTHTQNHFKVSQSIFLALEKNGYLYTETRPQWFSPEAGRFLPDRYVEGTCYICGDPNARSDQCDNCGNVLESDQLIEPRSKVDGSRPELRDTEHFFLDLSKLEPEVTTFLEARQDYWRETVLGQSLGQIKADGLKPRPITRDLDWGIPIPRDGWDGKRLYVWFEAVIGYLSAAIELAALSGKPDRWKEWWTNPDAKAFYFIGKDNIFFHAAWWPAQLLGTGAQFLEIFAEEQDQPLVLPYDVPANQFMNMQGKKLSGSRNWVVDGLDFLERYDPDPLRYYLAANMPENRDSDWDWAEFVARNNNELVATWGNLVNRVLSFSYRHWDGRVPEIEGELGPDDDALLETVAAGFETIGDLIERVRLRAALQEAMRIAGEVNRYLDQTAPWFAIRTDRSAAARSVYTAIRAIDSLKVLFAPFLPFTSSRLHGFLSYSQPLFGEQYTETVADNLGDHAVLRYRTAAGGPGWQPSELSPGTPLAQPEPLFKKLDDSTADEELNRLGIVN